MTILRTRQDTREERLISEVLWGHHRPHRLNRYTWRITAAEDREIRIRPDWLDSSVIVVSLHERPTDMDRDSLVTIARSSAGRSDEEVKDWLQRAIQAATAVSEVA